MAKKKKNNMKGCKQCTKCKQWKQLKFFNKNKNHKDRLTYHCKECRKEYRKGHQSHIYRTKVKRQVKYSKTNKKKYNKMVNQQVSHIKSLSKSMPNAAESYYEQ